MFDTKLGHGFMWQARAQMQQTILILYMQIFRALFFFIILHFLHVSNILKGCDEVDW